MATVTAGATPDPTIRRAVIIECPRVDVFELFTRRTATWWLLVGGSDATIAAHEDGGPHSGETAEMSAQSQCHIAAVQILHGSLARSSG